MKNSCVRFMAHWLKAAALIFLTVDHVGLYFMEADDWWLVQQLRSSPTYSSRLLGYFGYGDGVVALPYWFAVFVSATSASAPWLSRLEWRFSLRTLLIAITLIALGLGMVAWLTR